MNRAKFTLCLKLAMATSLGLLHSSVSAQESCVVKGNSLKDARDSYAQMCSLPREDCDPFDGEWFCASFRMNSSTAPALTATTTPVVAPVVAQAPVPVAPPVATPAPNPVAPLVATPVAAPVTVTAAPQPIQQTQAVQMPAPVIPAPVVPAPLVNVQSTPQATASAQPQTTQRARQRPSCASATSDPDGDGFGWENNRTCLVTASTATGGNQNSSNQNSGNQNNGNRNNGSRDNRPSCVSTASDPDGNGFGFENNATCLVTAATSRTPASTSNNNATSNNNTTSANRNRPACTSANSDPDGDGFGWENNRTCIVTTGTNTTISVVRPQSRPSTTSNSKTASDITDLILVTGQSNALGALTSYNPRLDSVNQDVFAFTNVGWQVADLRQIWDLNWHPRNHPNTDPYNNFAFHFGKRVAENSNRVVGFILATAPGAKISHWEPGGNFAQQVEAKVLDAINQLPHKSSLDGILWHQGESDNRDEPFYSNALYRLIFNYRSMPWGKSNMPFICGETKLAPVNRRLNLLNGDPDPNTACVAGADLSTRDNGAHFDAAGLRTLGARYAAEYLNITR